MFNFLRREIIDRPSSFIALDIGTQAVKALVCEPQGENITIRGIGKTNQQPGTMHGGSIIDIGSIIENCTKAIAEARKAADAHPDSAVISIGGDFIKGSIAKLINVRREPHVKIDLSELKQIIHSLQWKSFEEHRRKLAQEMGCNEIEMKLVNCAIIDVAVDGYRMNNPIGFQGKEVSVTLFNSFAPLHHLGALQTIAAELDMRLLGLISQPYAITRCIEPAVDQTVPELNALIIDVGAGSTDVSVVRSGVLAHTASFAIAGRTFTKRIAAELNVSLLEAENIKRTYSSGVLEKNSEKIVRNAIKSDIEVWRTGVIFSLIQAAGEAPLPSHIFLCGGGSLMPEIKMALDETGWRDPLNFTGDPTIALLVPKHLPHVHDATRQLQSPADIAPLALARAGQQLIEETHLMDKILKNVMRLMHV